jgi:hypothetical protein
VVPIEHGSTARGGRLRPTFYGSTLISNFWYKCCIKESMDLPPLGETEYGLKGHLNQFDELSSNY